MRRTIVALVTATALSLGTLPLATAAGNSGSSNQVSKEVSSQFSGKDSDALAKDASSNYNLDSSSYNKWLNENVATTGNQSTNTFLKLLVDFLIGIGVALVAGSIYGEVVRLLP